MISELLVLLENGLKVMRANSKMVLVGILVFVFPLLFAWLTHNFFVTATTNIETSEKQRISSIHDSIATIATMTRVSSSTVLKQVVAKLKKDNQDITKTRIISEVDNKYLIIFDSENAYLNLTEKSDQLYRNLPPNASEGVYIYKLVIDGKRIWQVLSTVEVKGEKRYIFTEHDFSYIDSVMLSRKQQSYLGLSAIFLFLIALAYWLNRQTDWYKKYKVLTTQLAQRDNFTNMIAHEFRTPLTVIKGYASFLNESKSLTQEDIRYIKNIHTATEQMVFLVNDFLEVARLQSGKLKVELAKINLNLILNQVSTDLQSLAHKKNLELVLNTKEEPIYLVTDANRLKQILINIVTNAIKYTGSGTVTIEAKETKDSITIVVKDTGMGISATDQKDLFVQ